MRIQSDHWAVILDFAEQHPEIITNKSKSLKGREVLQQSWKELTVMLNSPGMGEKKTEECKKTIIDWKSKTKAKAGSISTHLEGTGGGPPQNVTLTSFEERLLAIMGKVDAEGNPKVMEVG
ncbi:uncharacterized protein LOC115889077 [Sitophilus oryzae]|uniref:Regulatory protein zeste n=1 Tax=Sitophilus oryzae TaxID=7048 RepID=A0A6J2YN63_SITOR|nr:uncharacterized protein LOC115889077 [Sitophilus oryzae]